VGNKEACLHVFGVHVWCWGGVASCNIPNIQHLCKQTTLISSKLDEHLKSALSYFWVDCSCAWGGGGVGGQLHPSCRVVVRCRMSSRTALRGCERVRAALCEDRLWASTSVPGAGVALGGRVGEGEGTPLCFSSSCSPGQLMKTSRCASEGADCTRESASHVFEILEVVLEELHCRLNTTLQRVLSVHSPPPPQTRPLVYCIDQPCARMVRWEGGSEQGIRRDETGDQV